MERKFRDSKRHSAPRKRILVLGSRGMLGTDLMKTMMGSFSIHGLDLGDIDITHRGPCIAIIKELKPDLVINAVAYTDVDGSEDSRDLAFNVNADAARNVAIACHENSIRLFHISTDYVFNGVQETPYTEEDKPNPVGIYAESKYMGEKLVQQFHPETTICRTSWLFGKSGNNFVTTILKLAQQGDNSVRVVDDQVGSPTYTKDLAMAITRLVEIETPPIIHISNDGYCSWFQFARKILDTTGFSDVITIPVKTSEFGRPAPRPAYSVLNCDRYAKLAGSKLRHWESALIDFLEDLI